ncbi:MAG TPA: bifunctional riboflavin kinase/FAD synthetase [Candidatus Omnitrophota bacterium]|nr:bifunctional riboflavin kinase/FAD synthetase [Candidatus Omnitrophota bacterium]
MKILHGYRSAGKHLKDPVVAIGVFDGVHLGHRKVVQKMISSRSGDDKVVLTFDPHPQAVLNPRKGPPRIMSLSHRLRLFQIMGVDAAVVVKFSRYLADMGPGDFVDRVLVKALNARKIFVGENFNFGRGGSEGTTGLKKLAAEHGVDVEIVGPVRRSGRVVSSTWVRELISRGELEKARKLLSRPVSVLGTVVEGDSIGREIGVPTANIDPHHEVIPPVGVYAVAVDVGGEIFPGVLNIGYKPTFYGRDRRREEPVIEAHIIGFKGDIYGMDLEVFFIKRLRGEMKFSSRDELRDKIKGDIKASLRICPSFLKSSMGRRMGTCQNTVYKRLFI